MDQREIVRVEIEESRAALAAKLAALEERALEVRNKARRSIDIRYQTQQHPWQVVGISVAAGFVLGLLTS